MSGADDQFVLEPTLDEAQRLAADYTLIPVRHSFIDDCETPVSAFLKLRAAAPSEPAFLLESAEQGQRMGRYSFIGIRPREVLRWNLADGGDPYAVAGAMLDGLSQAPLDQLPPFAGGLVGYFGYDLVRTVEPLAEPNPDQLGLPDMALMRSDVLVVFDHLRHTLTILVNAVAQAGELSEVNYAAAVTTIAEVRAMLAGPLPAPKPDGPTREAPKFSSNFTREQFESVVAKIVDYIHAGDAFQVVPSQRWTAELEVDPFSIYRGLRVVNPSPYMYFLEFGDFQVVGASPEPLLTVSGRSASTRPIAGTRARGATRRILSSRLAS